MQLLNETQRKNYLDIWHRDKGISSSGLKVIACISMLISHIVQCNMLQKFNIYPTMTLTSSDWRVTVGALMLFIGRIAFPIFAFLIVNGMFLTRSVEKYIVRLFSFAIISEIPFDLAISGEMFDFYHQNVFFTLALSACLIFVVEKIDKFDQSNLVKAIFKLISVAIFCVIANYYHTDYSMLGILAVFLLYLGSSSRRNTYIAILFGYFFEAYMYLFVYLSIPIIHFYNGKKGNINKWAFYIFYPTHLLLISFIRDVVL